MRELVVVSGKGGTGKTSVTASFALLAQNPVVADCDVDAADLHLLLAPVTKGRHPFHAGHLAVIREEACGGSGLCLTHCRFGAVRREGERYRIDPASCEGCGVCVRFCPSKAIDFPERLCGEWMVSETRAGPMVHARLAAGGENSGKLVATVRGEAKRIAEGRGSPWIIVDGPPGIGCPVIASVTGASRVVAVTEPTVSGEHDLARLLALTGHFRIPSAVTVNKWDLDPGRAARIEDAARASGAHVLPRIRYDAGVTRAQLQARAVVETDTPAAADIREIWRELERS